MECAERGLIPAELLEGLDLRFGSVDGLLGLMEQIINRQGLGDILADGPAGVAEKLGDEAASYFMHVKNQPLPLHEPRWKSGMGIGFAISPSGADHMHNIHDAVFANEESPAFGAVRNMGILDAVGSSELGPGKARLFVYMMLQQIRQQQPGDVRLYALQPGYDGGAGQISHRLECLQLGNPQSNRAVAGNGARLQYPGQA